MNSIGPTIITIIGGVITLAIIAVVVSQKAQTPQVLQSSGGALASIIGAAVQPVTGATSNTFGSVGQNVAGTTP